MALKKYIVDLLQDNPLNGISTYIDVLTLSTGVISRKIKKMVLTGQENWTKNDAGNPSNYLYYQTGYLANKTCVCSHLADMGTLSASKVGIFNGNNVLYLNFGSTIMNAQPSGNTVEGLKEYLAAKYAAGTPVTVWYVLANETTEQITVPTGLSGTVDGYTTQTGTPTPTAPIYPTANTVTMWANYTPSRYNGNAFVTATGQPEQYNGGWS